MPYMLQPKNWLMAIRPNWYNVSYLRNGAYMGMGRINQRVPLFQPVPSPTFRADFANAPAMHGLGRGVVPYAPVYSRRGMRGLGQGTIMTSGSGQTVSGQQSCDILDPTCSAAVSGVLNYTDILSTLTPGGQLPGAPMTPAPGAPGAAGFPTGLIWILGGGALLFMMMAMSSKR